MWRSSRTSSGPQPERAGTALVALALGTVVAALAGNVSPPHRVFAVPLVLVFLLAGWRALSGGGRRLGWWAACGALLGLLACALAPRWPGLARESSVPVRFTFAVRDGWTPGVRGWGTRVRVLAMECGQSPCPHRREMELVVTAPVGRAQLPRPGSRWEGSGDLVRGRRPALAAGFLRVKTMLLLTPQPGRPNVDVVRDHLVRSLQNAAGADPARLRAAGFASALVLQRREELQAGEVANMRKSGLVHILAVSGLHVGLVGVLVWGVLTLFGVLPAIRRWGVVAALIGFAVLAGGNAPVVRAAAAGVAYLAARQLGRTLEPLPVVWAIVAGLVLVDPSVLLAPGFELSAFVALALVRWVTPVAGLLRVLPLRVGQALAVALVAQAASAPLVGAYFAALPTLGVLANLAAAPLELVVVGASLLAVGVAPLSSAIGGAVLPVVQGGKLLLDSISSVGGVGSWPFPPFPPLVAGALVALGLVGLTRSRWSAHAAVLAVAGTAAWMVVPALPGGVAHRLRVLGVHDGMAVLLQSARSSVLVDCGRSATDAWRELARARVRHLDALVVTHPDADHVGGAAMILERMRVARLCFSTAAAGRSEIVALRRLARRRGVAEVPLCQGQGVRLGAITGEVLWPPPSVEGSDNDASLVVRLDAGGVAVLISGDLEAAGERNLVATGQRLAAQVLQLPHHGSGTSSTPGFLRAVRPVVAFAASGSHPRFAYPNRDVARRVVGVPAVLMSQTGGQTTAAWGDSGRLLVGGRTPVRVSRARGGAHD
jgi:competence protein ComEC